MTRSLIIDIAETTVSPRTAGFAAGRRYTRISAATLLFAGLLLVYLAVAAWLVFLHHSIMEDALSRVANAQYVLFSREPKLANIGFVWTPLPSLLVLPFLPLKALWPPLVEQGFLANILSAVAMAASARVLVGLLDDLWVPPRVALTLVVAFGLQPIIVWFGANGMTEALLILFLLLTSRCLVRWLNDDDFRHLMAAGGYLALGYLARYEMLAAGCAAVALIAIVTWRRLSKEQASRRNAAIVADTLLVGAPLLAAFLFWAIASWVIIGHPFDQFSSAYGNSALVETGGGKAAVNHTLIVMQWLLLAPVLPLVVIAASVIAVRRRDIVLVRRWRCSVRCWLSRHWCTSPARCSGSSATKSSSSRCSWCWPVTCSPGVGPTTPCPTSISRTSTRRPSGSTCTAFAPTPRPPGRGP